MVERGGREVGMMGAMERDLVVLDWVETGLGWVVGGLGLEEGGC